MEAAETSVEPQIRYKPGPRSRKHKLIVKETEKESESIAAGAPKEVNTVEIVETEVRSTNQSSPKRKADTGEEDDGRVMGRILVHSSGPAAACSCKASWPASSPPSGTPSTSTRAAAPGIAARISSSSHEKNTISMDIGLKTMRLEKENY